MGSTRDQSRVFTQALTEYPRGAMDTHLGQKDSTLMSSAHRFGSNIHFLTDRTVLPRHRVRERDLWLVTKLIA